MHDIYKVVIWRESKNWSQNGGKIFVYSDCFDPTNGKERLPAFQGRVQKKS